MALLCQESWPLAGAFCKEPTSFPQPHPKSPHWFLCSRGASEAVGGAELFGLRTKGHWIKGKVFSLFPKIVRRFTNYNV